MSDTARRDPVRELNHSMPAAAHAQLGTTLKDVIDGYNDMAVKFAALLAHVDAANVAGVGTGNAVAFALTKPVLLPLGGR